MNNTTHITWAALAVLSIGILSIIINYRNIITLLLTIELLLLTICLLLSTQNQGLALTLSIIIIIQILTIAAAETATGLSILITHYRIRGSVSINSFHLLRG